MPKTLDKNYLHIADENGAEIRPLHLVTKIEPVAGGYRVYHSEFKNGVSSPGSTSAKRVILAAGSMGSTELLLQCRDVHETLPNLSARSAGIGAATAIFSRRHCICIASCGLPGGSPSDR